MGKAENTRSCSICGGKFSSSFKGIDYCNKHYLRMYFKGTTEPSPYKTKNTYKIIGDIAYGETTKGIPFIIDADDVDKCKMHTWCRDPRGYFVARIDRKTIGYYSTLTHVFQKVIDSEAKGCSSIKEIVRKLEELERYFKSKLEANL